MSERPQISDAALAELKDRNPCDELAGQWVKLRRHGRGKTIGPCPICSSDRQDKTATRFEATQQNWVCAVCNDGGDVIKLAMKVNGLDFLGAVAWLGGTRELDPAEAERQARARADRDARRDADAKFFRERERGTLYEIWINALDLPGSLAAEYLMRRGLVELPPGLRLRCVAAMPYWAHGGRDAAVIGRFPAMVAPIVGLDGKFSGLHFTYLDPAQPSGKVLIADPESDAPLPAKKVRGSKAGGGHIELVRCESPRRMIVGEGIETVLSVWLALTRVDWRDLGETSFWSAVDLGNLGGRALESVAHPLLKTGGGRPARVPGPQPDPQAPGLPIPDSVEDLVLLGDGDSDAFLTRCALARASVRYGRPGRAVRAAWAPAGQDFNDVLREAA